MAAPECGKGDGYCELRDVLIELNLGGFGEGGGGGKGGGFGLCFWLYLSSSARPSSVILSQVIPEDDNEVPFLALSEANKLLLFPLLRLHREVTTLASSYPWTDTINLLARNECPLEKWLHIGCEVTGNRMCLHIDGNLVVEINLCSLSDESHHQDDASVVHLVGNIGNTEGYVYNIQVLPILQTIQQHYAKNLPVKLYIDSSCLSDGAEEDDDGILNIVGGKASCRRNFVLEVVLADAFGEPVNKEMEVIASLVYADNGAVVEKSRDYAEAPLLISCEGLEYPATSKPLPIIRGRAIFKLKMSQLSSKCDNKLFRVSFRTLHTQRYPFLEAYSKPIRCISRHRSSRPLGFGKRVTSSTLDDVYSVNSSQGFVYDGKGNDHLQPDDQNSVKCFHPSKISKIEGDGSAMAVDTYMTTIQAPRMVVGTEAQNAVGTDCTTSDSDSIDAKSSWSGSERDKAETLSDAMIFRYCLEGTYERSMFLRCAAESTSEDDLVKFADQVSLYSGCSHHRNQILMSKQLLREGADTWSTISKNNDRVLWTSAIHEIIRKFMAIAHSTNRGLSEQDLEVLRAIAGCGDDFGKDEFDRLWSWLYPVAYSLSKDKIDKLWDRTVPRWIEGLITIEEAENALRSSRELLKKPGTFVLRFPTTRSWPHPDAGSLVVTYVGSDNTIHHRLLSLDCSEVGAAGLQDLLLQEHELSQLARVNRLVTAPQR